MVNLIAPLAAAFVEQFGRANLDLDGVAVRSQRGGIPIADDKDVVLANGLGILRNECVDGTTTTGLASPLNQLFDCGLACRDLVLSRPDSGGVILVQRHHARDIARGTCLSERIGNRPSVCGRVRKHSSRKRQNQHQGGNDSIQHEKASLPCLVVATNGNARITRFVCPCQSSASRTQLQRSTESKLEISSEYRAPAIIAKANAANDSLHSHRGTGPAGDQYRTRGSESDVNSWADDLRAMRLWMSSSRAKMTLRFSKL